MGRHLFLLFLFSQSRRSLSVPPSCKHTPCRLAAESRVSALSSSMRKSSRIPTSNHPNSSNRPISSSIFPHSPAHVILTQIQSYDSPFLDMAKCVLVLKDEKDPSQKYQPLNHHCESGSQCGTLRYVSLSNEYRSFAAFLSPSQWRFHPVDAILPLHRIVYLRNVIFRVDMRFIQACHDLIMRIPSIHPSISVFIYH